jgi:hypothetical protein
MNNSFSPTTLAVEHHASADAYHDTSQVLQKPSRIVRGRQNGRLPAIGKLLVTGLVEGVFPVNQRLVHGDLTLLVDALSRIDQLN